VIARRLQTANVIFDGARNAGEATAPGIKEGPAATMFSDEVCRSVLGGKPRHHKEIGIFCERPEPNGAAMIGIAVDDRCRREFLDRDLRAEVEVVDYH
jgi:hypothetical protein